MSPQPVTEGRVAAAAIEGARIVNDFSMVVATVHGSGSQTSNVARRRALFRMGIPVGGKNLFPSNIQGLPTWFLIRVSADGYTARRENSEVLVAMNQVTFAEDLAQLTSGGVCYYPDHFKMADMRGDVIYYPFPLQRLLKDIEVPKGRREYIANIA